jgi:nicotinamide mononucleotide adenylyltransferase
MAEFKATADKESSSTEKKYSFFIGRWQPWHAGHRWLIDQRLNEGKNVWIAIRDVKPDDKNPFTATEVLKNLTTELEDLIREGRIFINIVPDIESINYGRGVGYDVIEHVPPQQIHDISATKIREQMKAEGKI